jgi:hypothetical protein
MNSIKNIYYDIAMLGKFILILPFVNETDFKLLNDSDVDSKLEEFGLDCISTYNIDPCPLEKLQSYPAPEIDFTFETDTTQLCMPDPE